MAWVPNCKQQGGRDRPAVLLLQAPSATSDAKIRALVNAESRDLDNQKIRGSGAILTMGMRIADCGLTRCTPQGTVQRIILFGHLLLMGHGLEEFRAFVVVSDIVSPSSRGGP